MSKLVRNVMQDWQQDSYLAGANAAYLDDMYEQYLADPASIPESLQRYFQQLKSQSVASEEMNHATIRHQLRQQMTQSTAQRFAATPSHAAVSSMEAVGLQVKADALIQAYRMHGHRAAQLDPLAKPGVGHPALDPAFHGIIDNELAETVYTRGVMRSKQSSLAELLQTLKVIYTCHVSAEYSYVSDVEEQRWLQEQVESSFAAPSFTAARQRWIAKQLVAAEGLEKYLGIKYVGQKRFSIEGLDSLIPQLNTMIATAAGFNVKQVVMGMAHRGRLNVMLNVAGMTAKELIAEFEGKEDYGETSGDVRYHLGYSADLATEQGDIHTSLAFNPSHLEFINPVLAGGVRARQRVCAAGDADFALGILMHGDSSFAGEGVVYESMNMANLRAYTVGGLIHIITNNQLGFTTSEVRDIRSSCHCSDIAKLIEAPVFHVNADYPEAAVQVAELAVQYRMRFHKDVVINLVGYRRHGHQEVDEPTSSAPGRYQKISQHPSVTSLYKQRLIAAGVLTEADANQLATDYEAQLDSGAAVVKLAQQPLDAEFHARWQPFLTGTWEATADTALPLTEIQQLGQLISTVPDNFHPVKPVMQVIKARAAMASGEKPIDWGFAENLVYASLLSSGTSVRMTGQDVRRGTFYHRHAFWMDEQNDRSYSPLLHLSQKQADLQLYDSALNEAGVLGFEYGYALTDPNSLVIWEAQYGDFANTAQVIIDQFISSAWQKWQRLCGLVMLLPHGYTGAGPEHSSARLERYLQLAAQKNIQITCPTTPAQIFHVLRRQVIRPFRRPLIVMSPKNLLRNKMATSTLDELATGAFQLLIPEVDALEPQSVKRVILCAGKLYYELLQARRDKKITDIVILRIEQLYPFPYDELTHELQRYAAVKDIVWCQEEPKNQGAWYVSRERIQSCLGADQQLSLLSRLPSAAPSAGYHALHVRQQERLIEEALGLAQPEVVRD